VLKDESQVAFKKIYALTELRLKQLRKYLDENLKKGYIRPSTSPAGHPLLFIKKKDTKEERPCIDYRELNNNTVKDRYPLPLIKEIKDRLTGAKWFTALDLRDAYYHIRIAEGDEWKTAFRTRYGHYEYLVMPFGLTNAPASFQRRINNVLRQYLDIFVIAYLNDILIYSKTLEEHEEHVIKVLDVLQDAKLRVKLQKSHFHVKEVLFLGCVIRHRWINIEERKVAAVRE
jgi:hypothetical protein